MKAFESLKRLRRTEFSAAIDLYCAPTLAISLSVTFADARRPTDTSKCIEVEERLAEQASRNRLVELFTIKRNLRAVRASSLVMFAQQVRPFRMCSVPLSTMLTSSVPRQFCGINAIAYCTRSKRSLCRRGC